MISTLDSVALLVAGVAAGLIGSAGGITSLVSYPALLAVGLPALPASVANNVAVVACWPGSALASRPELKGKADWLTHWAPVASVGGAAGSVLLLSTPAGVFARIVPFLVATGSLALLFEPHLTARRERRGGASHPLAFPAGLLALSLYNGYFGAGSGVMLLTLLLVLVERHLPTANALKNMLIGAAATVSAVIFVLWGPVHWAAVVPLAIGEFAGSRVGPLVARRLPTAVLRTLIVLIGMGLAVYLWVHPST